MESVAQRAIALIQKNGSMRSDQIAEALGVSGAVIASSLFGSCDNGTLVSCKVERPGSTRQVNEYRMSASGKGKDWHAEPAERKPPTPLPPPDAEAAAPNPRKAKKAKKVKRAKPRRPSAYKKRRSASAVRRKAATRAGKVSRSTPAAPAPASHRWALTSDGAFILLGSDTEIPRPAARSLVEFIRVLDRGEIAQAQA